MTGRMLTRRSFGKNTAAALLAGYASRARAAGSDSKTLRFVAQSDLRVLDPIWTTAYITRNHGYMVFDTLFALDENQSPHPQMAAGYNTSPDGLFYEIGLRDGLKFHDGEPVRANDCIASLRRWMVRDSLGQSLAEAVEAMAVTNDRTFTIRLKKRFPMLIEALAKVSSLVPHIMPERLAKTDPFKQITEMIGSGPFQFLREEFQPGHKAVYTKFANYVPRNEPPSWAAGGKVVKVDRVEWLYIPDAATAAAALGNGEVDWWETPPIDYLPMLTANPNVRVETLNKLGSMTQIRFNHLYPPFDNMKMRQAVLAVANQADFMSAVAGDPANWRICPSFFTCGSPMSSAAGAEALTGPRDFDKARKLVAEAGYKGEKIVILDAIDEPNPHAQALVANDICKKLGLNVELVAADWGTVVTRRASMEPPDKGGWNIFGTGTAGVDMADPALNKGLRANGKAAWFGWPSDQQIETLRDRWLEATDFEERKALAAQLQQRAFEVVPYIPTGLYAPASAFHKRLSGIIAAPPIVMWNVEKS